MNFALLGYPLGYSLSPILHNYFFTKEKINAEYVSYPLKQEELASLFKSKHFTGFNVTIPYKEIILPYCDELTENAKKIGAVNTIKLINNKYLGTNTDDPGFRLMLQEEANCELKNKKILLLGAGGAAKAIANSAITEPCGELLIYDIDLKRTETLKKHYASNIIVSVKNSVELDIAVEKADIIINATPVGMKETTNQSILNKEQLTKTKKSCLVIDIIYSPLKTKFLEIAESLNLRTINGLGMLAGQAILGQKFWFSENLRYNTAKEVLLRAKEPGISG